MLGGKTAVITGSTSGIGLAIARALAAEGANVVLNGSRPAEQFEEERARIERMFGVSASYCAADLRMASEVEKLMTHTAGSFGGIDILVNNAGIQHVAPIEDFAVERWDAIIAINLSAAFHAIRLATPVMKARGWGRIINIASAHALVASPFKSAYVAAKHGIAGLTKTVALELAAHRITVNAIAPGYVWTPLVEGQIPQTMESRHMTREQVVQDVLLAAQPTKQFVKPEEVAALAVFLASEEARSINGAILPMDGGWTAH
jgi:3-hydroxybutyrate dehydrogenase